MGGGLGGAAVALALARKGFCVRLIEQAPEFGVIGYGIQLGPNAFHMFDRLGVSEAVLAQAIIPNSLLMLDSVDGHIIARIPTGASFIARFKRPYIVIHRVDLHNILLDACKANSRIELMPLTNAIGYEDLGDIAPKAISTSAARRLLVRMACAQSYGSKCCGKVSLA